MTTVESRGHGPTRGRRSREEARDGWAFVAPTVAVTGMVVALPLLFNLLLSLQDLTIGELRDFTPWRPLTTVNYRDVVSDSDFWSSLGVTAVYAVGSTVGSIVVGLAAAMCLRRPFVGRGVVRAVMLLPYVAPVVAATYVWKVMLDGQMGIVNHVGQRWLGWSEPINFLGEEPWALITVIAFETWRYFPFAFLFITARLLAVPQELEEAALVDGASTWQRFRYVILPQLYPVLGLLAILRLIMTFNKFDDVYLLTGGSAGTDVVSVRVIDQLYGSLDVGAAAAEAVTLTVVLAVFLVAYLRLSRAVEDR